MTAAPAEPFAYGADGVVISKKEYLRYLGMKDEGGLGGLLSECEAEVRDAMRIRGVLRICPVAPTDGGVDLGFVRVDSAMLRKNLAGCSFAAAFAVTAGIGVDRLISKYSASSPSKALVIDAVASAAVEGAADRLCRELKERFGALKPRFSPGFGDLPLSFQRELCDFVDCPRRAGITLTESLLLVPMKSTTALAGIPEVGK